jgi:hypothetical protein
MNVNLLSLQPYMRLVVRIRASSVRPCKAMNRDRIADLNCHYVFTKLDSYAEIHRSHPFQESPDFAGSLRALIERTNFQFSFDL